MNICGSINFQISEGKRRKEERQEKEGKQASKQAKEG